MTAHDLAYVKKPVNWADGWRFVCECGASGLSVPSESYAIEEHRRHVRGREAMPAVAEA